MHTWNKRGNEREREKKVGCQWKMPAAKVVSLVSDKREGSSVVYPNSFENPLIHPNSSHMLIWFGTS